MIIEQLKTLLLEFVSNYLLVCICVSLCVALVTEVLKTPIKLLTDWIPWNRMRRILNVVILAIPVGLGVALDYVYVYFLGGRANPFLGIAYGAMGVLIYNVAERFKRVKEADRLSVKLNKRAVAKEEKKEEEPKVEPTEPLSAVEEFLQRVGK